MRTVQNKENTATGVALTARQRAMQTSRDPDKESAPSLIEYPEGLTNPLARSMSFTFKDCCIFFNNFHVMQHILLTILLLCFFVLDS